MIIPAPSFYNSAFYNILQLILYGDVILEKASYEKDTSGKICKKFKREAPDVVYNPTPHFAQETSQQKIK